MLSHLLSWFWCPLSTITVLMPVISLWNFGKTLVRNSNCPQVLVTNVSYKAGSSFVMKLRSPIMIWSDLFPLLNSNDYNFEAVTGLHMRSIIPLLFHDIERYGYGERKENPLIGSRNERSQDSQNDFKGVTAASITKKPTSTCNIKFGRNSNQ